MSCYNCLKQQLIIDKKIEHARQYAKDNGFTEMVIYQNKNFVEFADADNPVLEGKTIIDRVFIID